MNKFADDYISKINERFSFIDEMPAPCGVIDLDNNCLVMSNCFLCDLLKIKEEDIPLNLEAFSDFDFSALLKNFPLADENIIKTNTEMINICDSEGENIASSLDMRVFNVDSKNAALTVFSRQPGINDKDTVREVESTFSEVYEVIDGIFYNLPILIYIPDDMNTKFNYINKFTKDLFVRDKNGEKEILKLLGLKRKGEINSITGEELQIDGNIFSVYLISLKLIGYKTIKFILGINNMKKQRHLQKIKSGIDSVSGAYNKAYAISSMDYLLFKNEIEESIFSICYIDINSLSKINNEHGNETGDILLKKLVQIIKQNIRKSDYIARMESDEFVVILPNCSAITADRIMKAISDGIYDEMNTNYNVTNDIISYAMLEVDKSMNLTPEEIINQIKLKMK